MKRLLPLLALALTFAAGSAHAQLTVSEFSQFSVGYYSNPFPPDASSWSDLTAQSGPTAFTIGDFGTGTPGGAIGNGFVQWLGGDNDWSGFNTVALTGFASVTNATPLLYFYVEDATAAAALTVFDLADFGTGPGGTTKLQTLNFAGVDPTTINFWGFVVGEADSPEFGFTFDHLALSYVSPPIDPGAGSVPEPSTWGICGVLFLAGVATCRRVSRAQTIQA